jgi:hypothetical protein
MSLFIFVVGQTDLWTKLYFWQWSSDNDFLYLYIPYIYLTFYLMDTMTTDYILFCAPPSLYLNSAAATLLPLSQPWTLVRTPRVYTPMWNTFNIWVIPWHVMSLEKRHQYVTVRLYLDEIMSLLVQSSVLHSGKKALYCSVLDVHLDMNVMRCNHIRTCMSTQRSQLYKPTVPVINRVRIVFVWVM